FATGDKYDTFRATITALGHTIVPVSSFEADDLVGLDSLMLKQPYSENSPAGFSENEISAINSFVNDGGGLVVHAEGGTGSEDLVDNLNSLVSPYGVIYSDLATANSGVMVTDLVTHSVTDGVTEFGVDYHRRLVSITSPAIDLTIRSGEYNVLAVVKGIGGAGNVVMLSDTTLWIDPEAGSNYSLRTGDNQLLLENIVQFTIPEPATVLLLCLGSLLLMRKRRIKPYSPNI
ncbi:MAG: PEP-CTERM sorting domain-containing protein, partial [Planctomycetota bacterium]